MGRARRPVARGSVNVNVNNLQSVVATGTKVRLRTAIVWLRRYHGRRC